MCGVCGILNFDGAPVSRAVLKAMTDAIAHRGPDGEGQFAEAGAGLGHRRLAIIDLTDAASQPMKTRDGRYVISYNGEVYNFRELRTQLEAAGHTFVSRSDTEVVLAAIAEWGVDALNRFNGMFALALWDRKTRELLLARDRYGIKPLYYMQVGKTLLFASEIKAFLSHPAFQPELDPESLVEYFTFQNLFADRSLFKGVHLLPAGCYLRASTELDSVRRYWDFAFIEPDARRAEADYIAEVDDLFQSAVRRQLVSDVPISAYLSGGIDSGSITAIAARHVPNLKSFTVGFDLSSASGLELGFDERPAAEHLSYLHQTEHYEMVLKAGDMERCMAKLMWHLEEPRVGQSYPNFYAAQLAGKFGKVVLSGAGGDEIFGGYPWRYYRAMHNDNFEDYVDKYYSYWQRLIPNAQLRKVFAPLLPEIADVCTRDLFRDVFDNHANELSRPEDYINHSLYFEAKTFLHGLLVVEDKLSMANGLETRLPFLDNDLGDLAMQIPVGLKLGRLGEVLQLNENQPGMKTKDYYRKTRDGKLILRKVLGKYVPDEISRRKKQGFSGPDATWFKGESIEYVRSRLHDPNARLYEYLDVTAVRSLIDDHLEGRTNRRLLIWLLLSFEQWLETFLGKPDLGTTQHLAKIRIASPRETAMAR